MNFAVGQVLTPLPKPPITIEQLRDYAEASLDSNPIHLDAAFAKSAGFPSVIAHGMISMAFLADFLVSHFPESSFQILRMKTRFRRVTFPGDQLTCEGRIKEIRSDGSLAVGLATRNAAGDLTSEGEALLRPR